MKATIKSIAELANTSSATVSRALSNRGYVGAETRRRIESAALELGYDFKRSQLGQDEQNAKIVLVVSSNLISQVYIDYFKGLTAYLGEKGCFCFQAFSNANPEREVECIRFADQNRFGAVVLLNVAGNSEADFPVGEDQLSGSADQSLSAGYGYGCGLRG